MSSSYAVKVKVLGVTKIVQFSGETSIHETCKQIREKFEMSGAAQTDHGLFFPEQAKWLIPNKVIDFYDLKSGDLVEYKRKIRQLKFRTLVGGIKSATIDETLPVSQIVGVACARIGISNAEEYSLMPEKNFVVVVAAAESSMMAKKAKRRTLKVEDQIADDARWLNPDKTLAEQGLYDDDVVILKMKFFFNDQNIDKNDPIQLDLLYSEAKEAILLSKNPCTTEEAAQFGAIQMQIQYGDHEADKHKAGLIQIEEFVPPEYQSKDIERKILLEHKKLHGLSDLNSKFQYVQLSRSLKSFGITYFLVKERGGVDKSGKKGGKFVPALIGITKTSVMKLDMDTKEILVEWKLTQLRRWAASSNSFTLDFGDYAEAYYNVQTSEGAQMSRLIAGYIDIILKKRKDADKIVVEDEVVEPVVEIIAKPIVDVDGNDSRVLVETNNDGDGRHFSRGQTVLNGESEYFYQQKAFNAGVKAAMAIINQTINDLNQPSNLPPIGSDPATQTWRDQTINLNASNIATQIATHLATAWSIINIVTNSSQRPQDLDFDLFQSLVSSLATTLTQIAPALKLVASLSSDIEHTLVQEAGMQLVHNTRELLCAGQQLVVHGAGDTGIRGHLHADAARLASSAQSILCLVNRAGISNDELEDFTKLAANIESAVLVLVSGAAAACVSCGGSVPDNTVPVASRCVIEMSANLVACVGTCAPTVHVQQCTDLVVEEGLLMREAIGALSDSCGAVSGVTRESLDLVGDAARIVEASVAKLVEKVSRAGSGPASMDSELGLYYGAVMSACTDMLAYTDETGGGDLIIECTRVLTMASTQFVAALKKTAGECNDEVEVLRLINAAKGLATSTSQMAACAKDAVRAVDRFGIPDDLRVAVETFKRMCDAAAGPQLRDRAMFKVSRVVKNVLASSVQLNASIAAAGPWNLNQSAQCQMNQAIRQLASTIPSLVTAQKAYQHKPLHLLSHTNLNHAAKSCLTPGYAVIQVCVRSGPLVCNSSAQTTLALETRIQEGNLVMLDKLLALVADLDFVYQVDHALACLGSVQEEFRAVKVVVRSGLGETAQLGVYSGATAVQATITLLADCVVKGDTKQIGIFATDVVLALQALMAAVNAYTVFADLEYRLNLPAATNELADTLRDLILEGQRFVTCREHSGGNSDRFDMLVGNASKALSGVVEQMPCHRQLENAIVEIGQIIAGVPLIVVKSPGQGVAEILSSRFRLQKAAARINMAAASLLTASNGMKVAVEGIVDSFRNTVDATLEYGSFVEDSVACKLIPVIQDAGTSLKILLQATKGFSLGGDNPHYRAQMLGAVEATSGCMNRLLKTCSAIAVGYKECDEADRVLLLAASKIELSTEIASGQESYCDCALSLAEMTKLAVGVAVSLNTIARGGDMGKLASRVVDVAQKVDVLTVIALRAANLLALSDPSTTPILESVVHVELLVQNREAVDSACQLLLDPSKNQMEILGAASRIAKSISTICSICKAVGQNGAVAPASRQIYLSSATNLASFASALVQNIKQLALTQSDDSRTECKNSIELLIATIDGVLSLSNSIELSPKPARVCAEGLVLQRPILDGQIKALKAVKSVVDVVKSLCTNSEDDELYLQLGLGIKLITEALQGVVKVITISTPGQAECEIAINTVLESKSQIDQAIVGSIVNSSNTKLEVLDKVALSGSIQAFSTLVALLANVNIISAGQTKLILCQIPVTFHHIMIHCIASASQSTNLVAQKSHLDELKIGSDSLLEFLVALKGYFAGIKGIDHPRKINECNIKVRGVMDKLCNLLDKSVLVENSVEFVENIERIQKLLTGHASSKYPSGDIEHYNAYADRIEQTGKVLVKVVGDVISKAKTSQQYRLQSLNLADIVEKMNILVKQAYAATSDTKLKLELSLTLREVITASVRYAENMNLASGRGNVDQAIRTKLAQSARDVSSNVSNLITAAKLGSRGLFICQGAISNVNDIIADLESSLIFAQAGQLDPIDTKNLHFSTHKDAMMNAAKAFTEQIKACIMTIAGTQDEIAVLCSTCVQTLVELKNSVKRGAISISSSDKNMQHILLSSAIHVSQGLQTLISTAIHASGKSSSDPAMGEFRNAIKSEFEYVAELVRVTKLLSDESSRGLRAINAVIEEIGSAVEELLGDAPALGTSLPDEVATLAKMLAAGASSIITAGGKSGRQDELIAAVNVIKRQILDLARAGKAVAKMAPKNEREAMCNAIANSCRATQSLLSAIKDSGDANVDTVSNKQLVRVSAKAVAMAVSEIVGASSNLISTGYADITDLNVVAERELLAATSMIEASTKKLESFRPVESPGKSVDEIKFEGQTLEAAKAIAMATCAFVRYKQYPLHRFATSVQREIISKAGQMNSDNDVPLNDGTWSESLVSAAKDIASATQELCESAKEAANGRAKSRDRVIVAAKSVFSTTAHLLTSAMVKVDSQSQVQVRLRAAGKAVCNAINQFVKASEEIQTDSDTTSSTNLNAKDETESNIMEVEAQMSILKMEKELDRARKKLATVRKGKYERNLLQGRDNSSNDSNMGVKR